MPLLIRLWNLARQLDPATRDALVAIAGELVQRGSDRYSRARRVAEELAHERSTEHLLSKAGPL